MVSTTAYSTIYGGLQGGTSGATTGAIVGAAGGPFGAGVGALVGGAIGSLGGFLGGRKAKKAKKYMQKASAIASQREANSVADQYRQMLRTARVARAGSMAASVASGITTSSLSTSALSSIGSQAQYNVQYLAEDRRLYSIYKRYMEKAGQLANDYQNTMSFIGMAATAAPLLADAYYNNPVKPKPTTTTDSGTGLFGGLLSSIQNLWNPSNGNDINRAGVAGLNADLKQRVTIEDLV